MENGYHNGCDGTRHQEALEDTLPRWDFFEHIRLNHQAAKSAKLFLKIAKDFFLAI